MKLNKFNYLDNPYKSQRMTVFGKNGMVATSQPLAAQAGLSVLRRGGNAVDAAVATAAALTVLEPTSNGIGSDAFAIVWIDGKLHGLNSSGQAPAGISREKVRELGHGEMPKYGLTPVTVPGAPAAWAALNYRFGKLPLIEVLSEAIRYAENGFPVSPVTAAAWQRAAEVYKKNLDGDEFAGWFKTFTDKNDNAPKAGEIWRSYDHAETLKSIAHTGAESFYNGEIAEKIGEFSEKHDGFIRGEDLASFKPEWVDPISVNYRGYEIWELPPNGQGIIALIALNILKEFKLEGLSQLEKYHKSIEALKLAFADGQKYITDPEKMSLKPEELLSQAYAEKRSRLIGEKALTPEPGQPPEGGTVYLAAADRDGQMVSFIQSNYMGFGSGIVVPGTGIALQNRGHTFSLDPEHENSLEPGKRTYHTIIPGFMTKDSQPIGPFGVMGGFMQPQGHLQVVMNTIDRGFNPQAALDAPRWQWTEGKKIKVENNFPAREARLLAERGHEIQVSLSSGSFGRGQIIWKDENTGVLAGATEPRTDGTVAAF
ncbi:MAG: gamma-glutamyltransferase family protein [Halanaerobiaceae bacterium]